MWRLGMHQMPASVQHRKRILTKPGKDSSVCTSNQLCSMDNFTTTRITTGHIPDVLDTDIVGYCHRHVPNTSSCLLNFIICLSLYYWGV